MTGEDVTLTLPELRRGAYIGIDRYMRVLGRGLALEHGEHHDAWHNHVLGAWGEAVIAKTVGCYWPTDIGPDGGVADVADYHVRTGARPTDRLILHDEDDDDGLFVLVVVVRLPRFRIVGCCRGRDGKQAGYWRTDTGRPAYFVPQPGLHPFRR